MWEKRTGKKRKCGRGRGANSEHIYCATDEQTHREPTPKANSVGTFRRKLTDNLWRNISGLRIAKRRNARGTHEVAYEMRERTHRE